jgi:serine/threonine-protein kinase HipA
MSNLFKLDPDSITDIDLTMDEIRDLAKRMAKASIMVTGVQSKVSIEIEQSVKGSSKLTIIGFDGNHILKPQSDRWPQLPENEHVTMKMARAYGLETVPFSLVRMKEGELAYITSRIDRMLNGSKLPMEDMCQLTERLTEDKYHGSHEQISKQIRLHSENTFLDLLRYFEVTLFSFLTGNSDMHLKNFSMIRDPEKGWRFAPSYDLLCTAIVIISDLDQLALAINGKRRKLSWKDFREFGANMGLNPKQISNARDRWLELRPSIDSIVENSHLNAEMIERYHAVLQSRSAQLT